MVAGTPRTVSPAVWSSGGDVQGRQIRITVSFNTTTRAITGITTTRDPGCQWSTIAIGTGAGNSPNASNKTITVPEGDFTVPQNTLNQLASRGLSTIDEFDALQITAF